MDKPTVSKEQKQWNKQLTYHLDKYTQIRQWSDLANWLVKLKQLLADWRGCILQRQQLLKKLASCLNPSLPIALHQLTIQCYDIIMKNDIDAQILPLLSVGLFPFFQSATTRTKQKILQLFTKHLVKVKKELYPLATGFIIAILPGLLQMHQPLQKQIINAVDQFALLLGEQLIISAVWTAMLRAHYCRLPGFKYITTKLTLIGQGVQDQEELDQQQQQYWGVNSACNAVSLNGSPQKDHEKKMIDIKDVQQNQKAVFQIRPIQISNPSQKNIPQNTNIILPFSNTHIKDEKEKLNRPNYMPFKNTLVVNTIIACLQDSTNSLVVKGALDFLYKYLSLRGQSTGLQPIQIGLIIDHVLGLLQRRDMSMTRKINLFLFGLPDEDNKYNINQKNIKVMPLIMQSLQRHFNGTAGGIPPNNILLQNLNNIKQKNVNQDIDVALKILASFYIQHQHLIKETLKELAKSVLSAINSSYKIKIGDKKQGQLSQVSKRILPYILPHKMTLLQSLGKKLQKNYKNENQLQKIQLAKYEVQKNQILELLQFFIEKLLKGEEKEQILLETISLLLKILIKFINLKSFAKNALTLLSLVLNMYQNQYYIRSYDKTKQGTINQSNEQLKRQPIKKVLAQVQNLKGQLLGWEKREYLSQCIVKFEQFYVQLCKVINDQNKKLEDNYPNYMDIFGQQEFELVTRLVISMHKFKDKFGFNVILRRTKSSNNLKDKNQNQQKTTITASKKQIKQQQFQDIQLNQVNQQKQLNQYKNNQSDFKWCLAMCSIIKNPNLQYYLTAITTVVQIFQLSQQGQQKYKTLKNVIIGINNNHRYLNQKQIHKPFQQQLNIQSQSIISLALQKLWNLLTYSRLHQRVIPCILKLSKYFPDVLTEVVSNSFGRNSNNNIGSNNSASGNSYAQKQLSIAKFSVFWKQSGRKKQILSNKQLYQLNKVGLFLMLDFLDNDNPLVRYTTTLWINQSLPQFSRILDPLFQILLQPATLWYKTYQGQYLYTRSFQVNRTVEILKKLKLLIQHTKNRFSSYLLSPITQTIKIRYDHSNPDRKDNQTQPTYLQMLMHILVRYLQGRSLIFGLKQTQSSVDLIACELLQSLIGVTEDPELCYLMIRGSLQQILLCLHFAILNDQLVNQLQLLNLLKSILFNSNLLKAVPGQQNSRGQHHHKQLEIRNQIRQFFRKVISSKYFLGNLVSGLDNQSPYIKQRYVEFISLAIPYFLQYHINPVQLLSYIIKVYTQKLDVLIEKRQSSNLTSTGKSFNQITDYRDLNLSRRNTQILIILKGIKDLVSYFLDLKIKIFQKQKSQNQTDFGQFSLYSWNSFVFLGLSDTFRSHPQKLQQISQKISKKILEQLLYGILKTIIRCWTPLHALAPLYCFTNKGIQPFEYKTFLGFNQNLSRVLNRLQTDSIQNYIIHFLRVLFNKYPQEILNCIILDWVVSLQQQSRKKIIEILIMMGTPLQRYYEVIIETAVAQKIKKSDKKRKTNVVVQKNGQNQVILLSHIFSFYSYQNFKMNQIQYLTNIWLPFIKFLKIFINSRNPITIFLLLQIFYFFIQKHNPKQLLKDQKIKKQVQAIAGQLHALVGIATGKLKINFNQGFNFSKQQFLPFPASVYQVLLNQEAKTDEAKITCLFYSSINLQKATQNVRLYAFMVLRRIGYNLLQNIFSSSGDSQMLLVRKVRQTLTPIFPVIEDKKSGNLLFAQKCSQLLWQFLDKKSIYPKEFRNDLLQIFNKDDFFICTRRNLQHWARIMDRVIQSNKEIDIFIEYLSKVSLGGSIFFTKQSIQTKKKIKSFQRICFILYAGTKDKYNSKLVFLVQKIVDVIKNNDAPPPVLILILFCIRILILRTSNQALTKLFIDLWQMILFLLMGIFNKQVDKKHTANMNLVWAGLKLIQMISITQMSQFHTHQWIFFYDFVALKLVTQDSNKQSNVDSLQFFKCKPMVKKYLPAQILPIAEKGVTFDIQNLNGQKNTNRGQVQHFGEQSKVTRIKRHIIIKQDKIDDLQLLRAKALALSQYLIQNNSHKFKMDLREVQQLIQGDFLTLDQFIYKVQ